MPRVVAEFSASELPSELIELLPEDAVSRGTRWRVVLEEIGDAVLSTDSTTVVAIALGLSDADAGRLLDENEVFSRFVVGEGA